MIIDFHAHIYPEKIAEKATHAVGTFYGDAPMAWHGKAEELIKSGSRIGVEKYIVHSVATKPEQVESINNFIISQLIRYLSREIAPRTSQMLGSEGVSLKSPIMMILGIV